MWVQGAPIKLDPNQQSLSDHGIESPHVRVAALVGEPPSNWQQAQGWSSARCGRSASRCSRDVFVCLTWFCSRNACGEGGGFGCGESDQAGLDRVDLTGEVGGVRLVEERGQLAGLLGVEDAGVEYSLVRGAS